MPDYSESGILTYESLISGTATTPLMRTSSDRGVAETPTDRGVADLLDRMTVKKKAAQYGSVDDEELLNEDGTLDEAAVDEHLSNGIGHLIRIVVERLNVDDLGVRDAVARDGVDGLAAGVGGAAELSERTQVFADGSEVVRCTFVVNRHERRSLRAVLSSGKSVITHSSSCVDTARKSIAVPDPAWRRSTRCALLLFSRAHGSPKLFGDYGE